MVTARSKSDFVSDGRAAFNRGDQYCPYAPGTKASVWWRTGYSLAKNDRRIADCIDGYDRDDLGESPDF